VLKRRLAVGLLASAALIAGVALVALDSRGEIRLSQVIERVSPTTSDPGSRNDQHAVEATPPLALPRLLIPRLGVDAPTVTLGIDAKGAMQVPAEPTDVAWYNFSASPGEFGNAVMAGHVDYANYGRAVFWRLREARVGDTIQVVLPDATVLSYSVSSVASYEAESAPVAEIVGPTGGETLTLITCTGSFNRDTGEYQKRLVVRAIRST
jgi:LPXTG-site transpeptidase (sortase) family protein